MINILRVESEPKLLVRNSKILKFRVLIFLLKKERLFVDNGVVENISDDLFIPLNYQLILLEFTS